MNFTIPIKAQNSTSSRSRQLRGTFSAKSRKANRKRYIFTVITATMVVGTLVATSIGGSLQVASASDNFLPTSFVYFPTTPSAIQKNGATDSNINAKRTGSTNVPITETPITTVPPTTTPVPDPNAPLTPDVPVATMPTSPVVPVAQPATTPVAVTATPEDSRSVSKPSITSVTTATPQTITQPAAELPVDTASEIKNMTAAQANTDAKAVNYTSGSLTNATRNRILMIAAVATFTAALLFAISFIGKSAQIERRQIPIRYIVPVQEGTRS